MPFPFTSLFAKFKCILINAVAYFIICELNFSGKAN